VVAEVPPVVAEGCRKSALVWVTVPDGPPQAMWHVWHDDACYVLTGGGEQPDPGLDAARTVLVDVRSKDKGSRLVTWEARVSEILPGSEEWPAVLPALQKARLNTPDGEAAPARWQRESRLYRLAPTGRLLDPGTGSHAARPVETVATTRVPVPFTLGRRRR
jgi:hypothetical protein